VSLAATVGDVLAIADLLRGRRYALPASVVARMTGLPEWRCRRILKAMVARGRVGTGPEPVPGESTVRRYFWRDEPAQESLTDQSAAS